VNAENVTAANFTECFFSQEKNSLEQILKNYPSRTLQVSGLAPPSSRWQMLWLDSPGNNQNKNYRNTSQV